MPAFEALKQSILTECEEDYVGLWSVIRDAEEFFPNEDEAAVREHVLKLLRELLLAKEIKAGFPREQGKFQCLRIAPEKVLDRIESEWPLGRRPTIGEGLWFTRAKKTGRRLDSHVRKYGAKKGTKTYGRLQREASLASAHTQHKKRLRAKER